MMRVIRAVWRFFAPAGILLAWRQLLYEKKRLTAAVAGVTFGMMLMLFQLGLYNGILTMVVLPHANLGGEIVMTSWNYEYFGSGSGFSRRRLYQAAALPEIASASPLYFGFFDWANPTTGAVRTILAMGINPDQNPFINDDVSNQLAALHNPENVLFDTLSQDDYGPVPSLFLQRGHVETEAERKRINVAGLFTVGHTLAASADLILSDEAFFRIRPDKPRNMASVGLIRLKPGADPHAALERLRAALPHDVNIMRRDTFIGNEQDYWAKRTPIGFVSAAGMMVGMFVGGIVVYQVLYTDVNDNLQQYATLKAIGFGDSFFVALVLQEALILVMLSFFPAMVLTAVLNYEARTSAQIPTSLSAGDVLTVLAAVSTMCLLAGVLATRKLRKADPAEVF